MVCCGTDWADNDAVDKDVDNGWLPTWCCNELLFNDEWPVSWCVTECGVLVSDLFWDWLLIRLFVEIELLFWPCIFSTLTVDNSVIDIFDKFDGLMRKKRTNF